LDKDIPHDTLTFVNMSEFSAAKNDRHDHFVFVLQETLGLIHLKLDIVIPRLGTETDFFDLGVVDVCFVLFLLLLIFEFAEIHNPADRWLFVRSHLDQIEPRLASPKQRLLGGNNTELPALGGNDPDRRDPNLFVDAMLLLDGSRLRSRKGRRRPGSSRPLHPATGRTPP